MDLVDLHYLSITVEAGSLPGAAQTLGVQPSTGQRANHAPGGRAGHTVFDSVTRAGKSSFMPPTFER